MMHFSIPRCVLLPASSCIWLLLLIFGVAADSTIKNSADNDNDDETLHANDDKPWFMREMEIGIGQYTIPMSLTSILTLLMVLLQLAQHWWTQPSWAEASHILIKDHTQATQQLLTNFKKDINDNPETFAKMAQEWSACPSKANGGFLGKFRTGDMARNFNNCVFDPATPLNKVVGPIETSFGWHLIYIHERHLSRQALAVDG